VGDRQRQLGIFDQKLTANRDSDEERKPVTNPEKGNGQPPLKEWQEKSMTKNPNNSMLWCWKMRPSGPMAH